MNKFYDTSGCKFYDRSFDFLNRVVNNPIDCDGEQDCSKCGFNPEVAKARKEKAIESYNRKNSPNRAK